MAATKAKRSKVGEPTVSLSHMTAVLENIEQQNKATIEAVFAVERRLTEKFERRFDAIELRLSALEIAVKQNSADIRRNSDDIRKNSEDIRKNSEDIAALQREVERLGKILGADRDENAIQALERRVRVLEERVGVSAPQ